MATAPSSLFVSDFWQTNTVYSDDEGQSIRKHLLYSEAALLDVDRCMEELSRRKEDLIDHIQRCKHALAPSKKLPEEILARVFIMSCLNSTYFPLWKTYVLLTLTRVCSTWRRVALATQYLWSNLNVTFNDYGSLALMEDSITTWIARARAHPITLHFGLGYQAKSSGPEFIGFVERMVALPQAYRSLNITLYSLEINRLLSKISPIQFLSLEELNVCDSQYHTSDENPGSLIPPHITLPNIRNLSLNGFWDAQHILSVISLEKLEKLLLMHPLAMLYSLELLQRCPRLEFCTIEVSSPESTRAILFSGLPRTLPLPNLSQLSLFLQTPEDFCLFIDHLVLVELEMLHVFWANPTQLPANRLLNQVVQLSQRSGTPKIREVIIQAGLPTPYDVGILLRSLPHLVRIRLNGEVVADEGTLTGLSTASLGPHLEWLETEEIRDKEGMIDMLKCRTETMRARTTEAIKDLAVQSSSWSSSTFQTSFSLMPQGDGTRQH